MNASAATLFLAFCAAAFPAQARDDKLASIYANAFAAASEAETRCAGVAVDEDRLRRLMAAASISAADDAWIAAQFAEIKPRLEATMRDMGLADWCSGAWQAFGPAGLGAMRRSDK